MTNQERQQEREHARNAAPALQADLALWFTAESRDNMRQYRHYAALGLNVLAKHNFRWGMRRAQLAKIWRIAYDLSHLSISRAEAREMRAKLDRLAHYRRVDEAHRYLLDLPQDTRGFTSPDPEKMGPNYWIEFNK